MCQNVHLRMFHKHSVKILTKLLPVEWAILAGNNKPLLFKKFIMELYATYLYVKQAGSVGWESCLWLDIISAKASTLNGGATEILLV